MKPNPDQALQFAIMLNAGLPANEAILYFIDSSLDAGEVAIILASWQRSLAVKQAMAKLMQKSWQDMSLEECRDRALDLHYRQMAYFLFSRHYADLGSTDKAKADTARTALEAHKAGTAGKGDALTRFFDDINSGKLKLLTPSPQKAH